MTKNTDPWLDPAPTGQPAKPKKPTIEELQTIVALQQIELAQQRQIISVLLFQLSQVSAAATTSQTFDDFAKLGQDLAANPRPENVIDLQDWLDQHYPF